MFQLFFNSVKICQIKAKIASYISCRSSDTRASFDFALQREAEIAERNDIRRHYQHRTNDEPELDEHNEESEGRVRDRWRGRGRDYGGGSMSLYQRLVG